MAAVDNKEFLSDAPKEVKSFIWKVKDLDLALMANQSYNSVNPQPISMELPIGESIGLLSTWKLSLRSKLGDSDIIFLDVAQTGRSRDPEANDFYCQASVKKREDPAQDLISIEIDQDSPRKEFGNWRQLLDASISEVFSSMFGNELEIHVTFTLLSPKSTRGELADRLGKLLQSGVNSDFVIKVRELDGDYADIKVHKGILGARSSVFLKMLSSGTKEAATETLVIEDFSLACVRALLQYIYTEKLDERWKNVADELVSAADKYNLPTLRNFLDQHLHDVCTFSNAIKFRRLARLHELDFASKNINFFIASNLEKIED